MIGCGDKGSGMANKALHLTVRFAAPSECRAVRRSRRLMKREALPARRTARERHRRTASPLGVWGAGPDNADLIRAAGGAYHRGRSNHDPEP
jgi:hypothetical protein